MRKMKRKLILLLTMIMLGTTMAVAVSAILYGSIESYAANRMNPFGNEDLETVDDYLDSMWVGDWLDLNSDYTHEVLSGSDCVRIEKSKIRFVNVGTAVIRATRKSDNATKEYEFVISPAKEQYFERLIPERIRIGYDLHFSNLYIYRNFLYEGYCC